MANKVYHLKIEEDSEEDFYIGIHTSLEAFQLAFYINKQNSILLKRGAKDLENEKQLGVFSLFEWEEFFSERKCQLISNKFIQEGPSRLLNSHSLFELPERNEVYLLTEFKQADFFIKSTNFELLKTIQIQLNNWSMVTMTYNIALKKINSRMNIIFD